MTEMLVKRTPAGLMGSAATALQAAARRRGVVTCLIGAVLALGVLALALAHLAMPPPVDQLNYFRGAPEFPHPDPRLPRHQYLRLGLVLPMRVAIRIFGYSEAAYYAVPIFAALLFTVSVYALGCLLFSRAVGVAAALIASANALIFPYLLEPLPDVFATALFCAALAVTIAIRQQRPLVSASRWREIVALLAVGALLGWSYLTREYAVFTWPLIPALLWRRVGWRGLVWLALPLALTGLLELVHGQIAYGDPLARMRATLGHGGGERTDAIAATYRNKPRWWYITRLVEALRIAPESGWLLALLAGAVAGGLLLRRRLGILLAWMALVYVPLVVLGGLLDPSHPRLRVYKPRYWFEILPPIVLGGVGAGWLLARALASRAPALRRRAGLVASIAVLCLAGLTLVPAHRAWDHEASRAQGLSDLRQFRGWLEQNGDGVKSFWTDQKSQRVLRVYVSDTFGRRIWKGGFRRLNAPTDPAPGDYIVLFSTNRGKRPPCVQCLAAAEIALGTPVTVPIGWQPVWSTDDRQVQVYRVPPQ
jgi:hypothetical protein